MASSSMGGRCMCLKIF